MEMVNRDDFDLAAPPVVSGSVKLDWLLEIVRVESIKLGKRKVEETDVQENNDHLEGQDQKAKKPMARRTPSTPKEKTLRIKEERSGAAQKQEDTSQRRRSRTIDESSYAFPDHLPEEVQARIMKKNGSDVKCLIGKALTGSDVSKGQNRFSFPVRQVKEDFLNEREKAELEGYAADNPKSKPSLVVGFIDPAMREEEDMKLRKWDMKKSNGSVSSIFVIPEKWNRVREANDLKDGDTVQLWSFRTPDSKLWLVLVLLEKANDAL